MSLSCAVCGGCAQSPQSVLANMTELWSPWLHHILHYYMLAASKDIALYSCNTFTVCKLFHMFDSYEDWICCKLMLGGCYGVCCFWVEGASDSCCWLSTVGGLRSISKCWQSAVTRIQTPLSPLRKSLLSLLVTHTLTHIYTVTSP